MKTGIEKSLCVPEQCRCERDSEKRGKPERQLGTESQTADRRGWGEGDGETERGRDSEDTKPLPAEATRP